MDSEELPRYRAAWFALGWLLVLAVAAGSLAPSLPQAAAQVSDKFMHFAAYASMAFLFMGAAGRHHWLRIGLGLLLFGAGIELAQASLTETRMGDWLDLLANGTGVAAGIGAAFLLPGNWCRQVEVLAGIGVPR